MRIIGHMVTRNEEGRYFEPCVRWLKGIVDVVYLYDDHSSDRTREIGHELGVGVELRGRDVPPFRVHEAQFRQGAWEHMASTVLIDKNDWVLCVDADEFVVDQGESTRDVIKYEISRAKVDGYDSLTFPVPEVFGWSNGVPCVRVDGFWGSISATRLVRYGGGDSRFRPMAEGCGSVPAWGFDRTGTTERAALLHFGYARQEDRVLKHRYYSASRGHSRAHVRSILETPTLESWTGRYPELES